MKRTCLADSLQFAGVALLSGICGAQALRAQTAPPSPVQVWHSPSEHTPANADAQAIFKIRRQREQIDRNFGEVNAQSDAVPLETGERRPGDMAARDRIRRWQASLRIFYLLELPLLQLRVRHRDRQVRVFRHR
jgi:hypothetical protein